MACIHISLGVDPDNISSRSIGDPHLATVKDILVTFFLSLKLHAGDIGATVGL
jgi:cation transporter-like permease